MTKKHTVLLSNVNALEELRERCLQHLKARMLQLGWPSDARLKAHNARMSDLEVQIGSLTGVHPDEVDGILDDARTAVGPDHSMGSKYYRDLYSLCAISQLTTEVARKAVANCWDRSIKQQERAGRVRKRMAAPTAKENASCSTFTN